MSDLSSYIHRNDAGNLPSTREKLPPSQKPETTNKDKDDDEQGVPFESLPDDVIVAIGKSIGKLCSIKDYGHFAKTSKQIHHLLLDSSSLSPSSPSPSNSNSQEVMDEVVQLRINCIRADAKVHVGDIVCPDGLFVPADETTIPMDPIRWNQSVIFKATETTEQQNNKFSTLEQVSLLETMDSYGLLKENRIFFSSHILGLIDSGDVENVNRIHALRKILAAYPSTVMELNAHCGISAPRNIRSQEIAADYGHSVMTLLCLEEGGRVTHTSIDKERLSIHNWRKLITRRASRSNHLHGKQAREGRGWVDVYVRLQGSGGDDKTRSSHLIELPPRPFFYNNVKETDMDEDEQVSFIDIMSVVDA